MNYAKQEDSTYFADEVDLGSLDVGHDHDLEFSQEVQCEVSYPLPVFVVLSENGIECERGTKSQEIKKN
jgi:hypothetical protein